MLTVLLAALLVLVGALTGSSAAAAGPTGPPAGTTGGDGSAQLGRCADHDAVSGASPRLTSSRVRASAPRAQLDQDAADLPRLTAPAIRPTSLPAPGTRGTAARSAPTCRTLSRAPPA